MTDLNPDVPDKPIEVAVSPAGAQASTAARDVALILAILPALIAVIGQRDLIALIRFIGSTEFAPVLGLIVAAAVPLWRQWLARRKHANDLKMAKSADDSVAVVK